MKELRHLLTMNLSPCPPDSYLDYSRIEWQETGGEYMRPSAELLRAFSREALQQTEKTNAGTKNS